MESLFAISIKGTILYVKGNLSEQECIAVETIAKNFRSANENLEESKDVCQAFIKEVERTLHISLVHAPIKYVFRIK